MKEKRSPKWTQRLLLWWLLVPGALSACPPGDTLAVFSEWLDRTDCSFEELRLAYGRQRAPLLSRLAVLNTELRQPRARTPQIGYPVLLEKIQLEEELQRLEEEADLKFLRLRYRKSIEMVKMLYEKILSMDHHFTGLRTNQQIMRISNPHEYPEFKDFKVLVEERMKRKSGFLLPLVMEGNPYLSAAFSIVGLALGVGDRSLTQARLDKLSCILDFTVRIHQDLSVIYYETEYLRDANLTLKKECESLFQECSRQVGYGIPLAICRDNDDWERLFNLLDAYVEKAGAAATDPVTRQKAVVNLQFTTDRVVHFIEKYCAFVSQGSEYYKKFAKITGNYTDSKSCTEALPETFTRLRSDIDVTLEKFDNAYNLPEIQGSRLKDLLYGTGD